MHQLSFTAYMIVSALLLLINLPTINLENLSIIHNMYLLPNSFKSRVTTSLKDEALGRVTRGRAMDFWNFWQTLQSLTTLSIVFIISGLIHPAFLHACINYSLPLCLFTSWTFFTALKEHNSPFLSSINSIPKSSSSRGGISFFLPRL